MSNQKTEKNASVNVTPKPESNVTPQYENIADMEDKDIRKELRDIAPRHGKMSLTERNMLEALYEGGSVTRDTRDAKDRGYGHYVTFSDGSQVSLRPDGFRYLISKAKRYGLIEKKSNGDKVVTWTLPKNSDRCHFVKRLVDLFDAVC